MNESINPKQLDENQLRLKVYSEPTSKKLRPYIVEYLRRRAADARSVSNEDTLRGKGGGPSGYICGALAWQGADGVEGVNWITEEDEPELYRASYLSSQLDIDDDNQAAWDELLAIIDRL